MKPKVVINKLNSALGKYNSAIGSIEADLCGKIDFEFAIIYQPSDGFVLLDTANANNAPLSTCLKIIEEKGHLSHEDYLGHLI